MPKEEDVEEEEAEEEEEEAPAPTLEELRPRLYRLVYNQPTVLLTMFEVLFDYLTDRGIMTEEDMDVIIKEALRRWRDEVGAYRV